MAYCPICGAPEARAYFRLELGTSQKTHEGAWKLTVAKRAGRLGRGATPQALSPGYDGGRLIGSSAYDICKVGHVFAAGHEGSQDNVVKVLGVVAAGKSYLMQSLQQQSIPTVGSPIQGKASGLRPQAMSSRRCGGPVTAKMSR